MSKYYAVKRGRKTGIFLSLKEFEEQVNKFSGAEGKKFKTKEKAEIYLNISKNKEKKENKKLKENNKKLNNERIRLKKSKKELNQLKQKIQKIEKQIRKSENNIIGYENAIKAIKVNLNNNSDCKFGDVYAFVDGSFNESKNMYSYGGFLVSHNKEYILQGCFLNKKNKDLKSLSGELEGSIAAVRKAKELNETKLIIYYDCQAIEDFATGKSKCKREKTKEYYEFMQDAMKTIDITFRKVKAHSNMKENNRADKLAKEAIEIKKVVK